MNNIDNLIATCESLMIDNSATEGVKIYAAMAGLVTVALYIDKLKNIKDDKKLMSRDIYARMAKDIKEVELSKNTLIAVNIFNDKIPPLISKVEREVERILKLIKSNKVKNNKYRPDVNIKILMEELKRIKDNIEKLFENDNSEILRDIDILPTLNKNFDVYFKIPTSDADNVWDKVESGLDLNPSEINEPSEELDEMILYTERTIGGYYSIFHEMNKIGKGINKHIKIRLR